MRKDPFDECITPSNQQGLSLGYGIKPGECLTMQVFIYLMHTLSMMSFHLKTFMLDRLVQKTAMTNCLVYFDTKMLIFSQNNSALILPNFVKESSQL